jgi:hypothetical protein
MPYECVTVGGKENLYFVEMRILNYDSSCNLYKKYFGVETRQNRIQKHWLKYVAILY